MGANSMGIDAKYTAASASATVLQRAYGGRGGGRAWQHAHVMWAGVVLAAQWH